MPVSINNIRNELLPGLMKVTVRYSVAYHDWRGVFGKETIIVDDPHAPEVQPLDPAFSLDELENAHDIIEKLK